MKSRASHIVAVHLAFEVSIEVVFHGEKFRDVKSRDCRSLRMLPGRLMLSPATGVAEDVAAHSKRAEIKDLTGMITVSKRSDYKVVATS